VACFQQGDSDPRVKLGFVRYLNPQNAAPTTVTCDRSRNHRQDFPLSDDGYGEPHFAVRCRVRMILEISRENAQRDKSSQLTTPN
jgi:hypothetical protein